MSSAATPSPTETPPPRGGSGAGDPPPGPPPPFKIYLPGERPDYNRGIEIMATCMFLNLMALFFVSLRVYVRRRFLNKLSWDDSMMIMAAVTLTAMTGTVIAQVFNGAGRHIEYIPPNVVVRGLHYNFISQPLCLLGLGFARLSVSLFLIRFATSRKYRWILWFLIGLTTVLTVVGILQTLLQCRPMAFVWDKSIPGGQCVSTTYLVYSSYVSSALSCSSDFALAVLPIFMLRDVQMNRRVKLAVMGILSLGFFTVAAAIVKAVSLSKWGLLGDYLWDTADITIWFTAEISVAIIAGSIPCLKPLFKRILDSTRRYGSGGGSSSKRPPPNYICSCGKPAPSYDYGSSSRSKGSGLAKSNPSSNVTIGSIGKKRSKKTADPYRDDDDDDVYNYKPNKNKSKNDNNNNNDSSNHHFHDFELQVSPGARTSFKKPGPRDFEGVGTESALHMNNNNNNNTSIGSKRATGLIPTLTVNEMVIQRGRNSDEDIILPGTGGILRTTQISMSIDDAKEKSIKDMV